MELKGDKILKYKKILNGLPKFYTGTEGFQSPYWMMQQAQQLYGGSNKYKDVIAGPVNTSDDPYTKNKNLIPSEEKKPNTLPAGGIDHGEIVATTIGEVANQIAATNPGFNHDDVIAGADRYQGNVRGVSYDRLALDENSIWKEIDAKKNANLLGSAGRMASLGGKLGGDLIKLKDGRLPRFFLGGLIGGAAGAVLGAGLGAFTNDIMEDRARDSINLAKRIINRGNLFNQNQAGSTAIQNEYFQEYGDTRNQSLKGYKNGKRVQSAYGLINAKQNAWVDGGELIMNTLTGATQMVPNSKYTDSFPANLQPEDMVIPAKDVKKMKGYKCGKLPKHVDGRGWDNAITSGAQILGGLGNYMNAAGQSVKMPNSYFLNPYGQIAANTLAGLRVSDYPILPELYNQYAKGMYAISNSGGLSGGQRALARLSALNNLLANYAKLQQSNQIQNNQYRSSYADYIGRLGAQEAANKMQAYQYDLDYYSKAHAARQAGMQGGIRDMISGLQNYYKNKNKWDMFAMSHKLYSDELEAKKKGGYFSRV